MASENYKEEIKVIRAIKNYCKSCNKDYITLSELDLVEASLTSD